MKDKYLGDLLEGEVYEYFDGRACYIMKVHDNFCAVYETQRDKLQDWTWTLRTKNYLLTHIRTIIEVM